MKTYHYIVQGRVQGVAFRYYTREAAYKYGINGTVKNLFNGNVEVYAQGDEDNIEGFEAFLNSGPPSAIVSHLHKEEIHGSQSFDDFQVVF